MIKVLLVDDQKIIVQGMEMILKTNPNIKVVGKAFNGEEAVEICKKEEVDVVIMDIRMPIMNGVEATKKIKEYNKKIKIIVLTTFNDDEFIFSSLKNGASGYLLKDATTEDIIKGVEEVHKGGTLINPEVATKVVNRLNSKGSFLTIDEKVRLLTEREKDICHCLSEGMNNSEIAKCLYISEGTVKNNITRILDKLELRDRTQLALFSVKNNI